jgi:hypothetical protein
MVGLCRDEVEGSWRGLCGGRSIWVSVETGMSQKGLFLGLKVFPPFEDRTTTRL